MQQVFLLLISIWMCGFLSPLTAQGPAAILLSLKKTHVQVSGHGNDDVGEESLRI